MGRSSLTEEKMSPNPQPDWHPAVISGDKKMVKSVGGRIA